MQYFNQITQLNTFFLKINMPEDKQNPSLVGRIMGGEGKEKDVSVKDEVVGDIYTAGGAINKAGHTVWDGVGSAATAVGNKYSELTTTKKDPKDEFVADVKTAGGAVNKAGHDASGAINKAGQDTLDGVGHAADSVGDKYTELTSKSEQ